MTNARLLLASTIAASMLVIFGLSLAKAPSYAQAPEPFRSALRGTVPLNEEGAAKRMTPQINNNEREVRNYPEQPPLIPHAADGYQLDVNVNKCLSCHARSRTGESQAPMVSITHFMDRDGQFLATISPRRYFCTQCHVPQHAVKPPVASTFVDVDSLLSDYLEKAK